jgi:cytochrome P450
MECPYAHLSPLSTAELADPYKSYAYIRQEHPVFFDDELGHYVVSRHADVDAVFRDPVTFAAANAQDPVFGLDSEAAALLVDAGFRKLKTMSNNDDPRHTQIRQHTQVGFSPRRLRSMEPIVRGDATALIESFVDNVDRRADLVSALTFPLPAGIIFALLGFPPEDTEMLKTWCGDRMSFSWGRPTPEQQCSIAKDMLAYWAYCEAHVARRLQDPADDFTSDLLQIHHSDPSTLTTAEIAHVIYGMSFAGHETTTNLLSNTVRRVLEAGAWQELCDERSLIPKAVDEGLRFDSSVITWRRMTSTPTTVGGVELPAGAKLLLLLGSANRDPDAFEHPDEFDVHRTDASRHLSFGFGRHYCLGATLAKLEVQVVLEELTTRLPTLRLTDEQQLDFHPNVSFRGPRKLLVEW